MNQQTWLMFSGKPMHVGRKLRDYDIREQSIVMVRGRLRGGMPSGAALPAADSEDETNSSVSTVAMEVTQLHQQLRERALATIQAADLCDDPPAPP